MEWDRWAIDGWAKAALAGTAMSQSADPIVSAMVLRNMRREFEQLQVQYGHLAEFIDMLNAALVP